MDGSGQNREIMDARVRLEALIAGAGQSFLVLVTTPIWAALIGYAVSGPMPGLGAIAADRVWTWVMLVAAACSLGICITVWSHRLSRNGSPSFAAVTIASSYLVAFAINAAWASGFWLLWDDGNVANHLFLTVVVIAAVVTAIIGRNGDFRFYLSSVVPILIFTQTKWMTSESELATLFSILNPLWFLWLTVQVNGVCAQTMAAMRARYENEALAEALIAARDEAERSRKYAEHANATKTAFLANMSHELRTPLNAILGFSEIINTEALGPNAKERYRDYAGDIMTSGRHLLSLINDLLDIAKIEAGKLEVAPQWNDASRLVRECLHLMETRAGERRIRLTWAVAQDSTRIFADDRALRQILFNLVSNAIKFTPERGSVEVRVTRKGEDAVLTVEDTGCGIAKDQVERVFLPFEQIDNRYAATAGGTGLGLTLVKALSELHGGRCYLESEEGQGTQVHVHFPLPKAPSLVEGATYGKSETGAAAMPTRFSIA